MNKLQILVASLALLSVTAAANIPTEDRDKRAISLFSVVNFPNLPCQSTSDADVTGTCYSSTECTQKGGTKMGNCAAGFGACCTFSLDSATGGDVTQNMTIIRNNGFPTAIKTASLSIAYTVTPLSTEICQLRFDFIKMELPQTTATGVCIGTFTVTSPTGKSPPALCGDNSGYHLYSEVGMSSTATKITVATGATVTTDRVWRVRISQIECDNPNKPPTDCNQWYTAVSGTFESFNFNDGLLQTALEYSICIKQHEGMCGVVYSVDQGTTTPDPFGLPTITTPAQTTNTGDARNQACTRGRLEISGTPATTTGIYCGGALNTVNNGANSGNIITKGLPFLVKVVVVGTDNVSSSGFKLNYAQRSSC